MAELHVLLCFHTTAWQAFEDGGRNDNYCRLHLEVHREKHLAGGMLKASAVSLWRNA